jgi:hypothetical protein
MPQVLGLAFSKSIKLYVKDEKEAKNWQWPMQLQKVIDKEYLNIRVVGE